MALKTIPPYHLSSNKVENFMRHLGKAMKIGNKNNDQESNTLKTFLIPYRQTPYPYIKLPSPEMIFRN